MKEKVTRYVLINQQVKQTKCTWSFIACLFHSLTSCDVGTYIYYWFQIWCPSGALQDVALLMDVHSKWDCRYTGVGVNSHKYI